MVTICSVLVLMLLYMIGSAVMITVLLKDMDDLYTDNRLIVRDLIKAGSEIKALSLRVRSLEKDKEDKYERATKEEK